MKMRLLASTTSLLMLLGSAGSSAQDLRVDRIAELLGSYQSPLLFPAEFSEVILNDLGEGTTQVEVLDLTYVAQDLDQLTFTMTQSDEGRFLISDFSIPTIFSEDGVEGKIGTLTLAGIYDLKAGSYEEIGLEIRDVSLTDAASEVDFQIDSITLNANFDAESSELSFTGAMEDLTINLVDLGTEISASLPGLRFAIVESDFPEGQNPLSRLGNQLGAPWGDPADILPPIVGDKMLTDVFVDPLSFVVDDTMAMRFEMAEIIVTGEDTNRRTPGQGRSVSEFLTAGFTFMAEEGSPGPRVSVGEYGLIQVFEGADFSQTSPIYATDLYSNEPGDFAVVGDFLAALGEASWVARMEDFRVDDGTGAMGASLEALTMSFGGDLSGKVGSLDLALRVEGADVQGAPSELIGELLPSVAEVRFGISKLDMEGLRQVLSDAQRTGPIGEDAFFMNDLPALAPALQSWIQRSGFALSPSFSYEAETAQISGVGEFVLNLGSALGFSGAMPVFIEGFEALQGRIAEVATSGTPADQQMANGILFPLGMVGVFGAPQDDGSLLFDIQIDEFGSATVNGAPLPF